MKIFRFMSILSVAVIAMLTFMSCDKDDDTAKDVDSSVVGEWGLSETDWSFLFLERLNLKANGTFTVIDYEAVGENLNNGGSITDMGKTEYSGTYTATNGQLKMSANGKSISYTYAVLGNKMTLTGNDGSVTYDKMDSNIKSVFDSAEQWYQQHK